jgi:peptide deformylase
MEIFTGDKNPVLRQKSKSVVKFDRQLKKLVHEMGVTMKESNGLGLAAPQVGINERLFISTVNKKPMVFINPEIIKFSQEKEIQEEGCLSLPNVWGEVERAREVTVKFQDVNGKERIMKFSNLNARAIQHEYDHLEGILFTDKLEMPMFESVEMEYEAKEL